MKRIVWIVLIAPLFLQFQHSRGNFGGTWVLDLKKSANLPPSFASVESYVIDIKQSGDSLTVVAEMKGNGQTVPFPPFVYVLDGKGNVPARFPPRLGDGRRRDGPGRIGCRDGVPRLVEVGRPPGDGFTQHDDWKLAGGGPHSTSPSRRK